MILQCHQILSCINVECDGFVMRLTFLSSLQQSEQKVVAQRPTKIDNVVKHHGFLIYESESLTYIDVETQMNDWKELVEQNKPGPLLKTQSGRCINCGTCFCHQVKVYTSFICP